MTSRLRAWHTGRSSLSNKKNWKRYVLANDSKSLQTCVEQETAVWANFNVLWYLQELMASLESQKKASLSSRFRRRQKTVEEQEENDRKWKRIQVSDVKCELWQLRLVHSATATRTVYVFRWGHSMNTTISCHDTRFFPLPLPSQLGAEPISWRHQNNENYAVAFRVWTSS